MQLLHHMAQTHLHAPLLVLHSIQPPAAGPVPVLAQELPRLSLGKFKSPNVLFPGWGGDLF